MSTVFDDGLVAWQTIRELFKNRQYLGILLGNGASMAIWPQFGYSSLYAFACDPARQSPLTPTDQAFFEEMDTKNFEAVLSALATARMVCRHLKKDHEDIELRYASIRKSLISAVREIHIGYANVKEELRTKLGQLLSRYRYVYTTNYDLLIYWAAMTNSDQFKDFLWGISNSFDSTNSHEWEDNSTKIIYLHGALHLCHDPYGLTRKLVHAEGTGEILGQFDVSEDAIPLFVSEGTWKDKLRAIRRNEYLSFAYWKFSYHRGPLVVFGSSLSSEFDQHIIDAMKHWRQYDRARYQSGSPPVRSIAISVHPSVKSSNIIELKNRLKAGLPDHDLHYFDSTTHPLGDPALCIVN